jgi:hypothetical protein
VFVQQKLGQSRPGLLSAKTAELISLKKRNVLMICSAIATPVTGMLSADLQFNPTNPPISNRQTLPIASNSLERLGQLLISNDRLMDALVTSRARIVSARNYLDRPGCQTRFGSAHLERCRVNHSGILAQLRANRIEALHLLGDGGSND